MRVLLRLAASLLLAAGGLPARAADLNVFAAASLADALQELAPAYEARTGDRLRFNFAASSTLARQIREGAPADVFFSADEPKMDDLARAGLISADTRVTLLSNTLVIVVAAEHGAAIHTPADLATAAVKRLALAETRTVPAGIYARTYLTRIGLWEKVAAKVVQLENVRATLAAVEAGNAEAGIVYKTDALLSPRVRIAHDIPAAAGPAIAYPLAVLAPSPHPAAARRYAAFLASAEARATFAKYGFLPAPR